MRAIMISIKPEWVFKILNGEKTIEIRKSIPKCELPIKVYIYCTKDNSNMISMEYKSIASYRDWKREFDGYPPQMANGFVIAEFTLKTIDDFSKWEYDFGALIRSLDLYAGTEGNYPFLIKYLNGQCKGYAWHIDDLKIYDKPKELGEFKLPNKYAISCGYGNYNIYDKILTKPFKSWGYVKDLEEL